METLYTNSVATPLCFSRKEFGAAEFNVESFLTTLRRRATFEQIQEDLRVYLKILQNAMIELINKDYADFVNLSSNLVNLRSTVDKLDGELKEVCCEFEQSTEELEKIINALGVHLSAKSSARVKQKELEDRIRICDGLKILNTLLEGQSDDDGNLERLQHLVFVVQMTLNQTTLSVDQNQQFRLTLTGCIDRVQAFLDNQLRKRVEAMQSDGLASVLGAYEVCGRTDAALAVFMNEFLYARIRRSLEATGGKKSWEKLRQLCGATFELAESFSKLDGDAWRDFVRNAVLTALLGFLDSDFGEVLIPSDPDAFHSCFLEMMAFARRWPAPHRLLKLAVNKFSLAVYFRLRCDALWAPVQRTLLDGLLGLSKRDNLLFRTESCAVVFDAVEKTWSEPVHLLPLTVKFWDFTLKILVEFKGWLEKVGSNRESGRRGSNGTVKALLGVMADVPVLEKQFLEVARGRVWSAMRTLGRESTVLESCLAELLQEIHGASDGLAEAVVEELAISVSSSLAAASEIPRQYRWTRKQLPSQPSPYLQTAFAPLSDFLQSANDYSLTQTAMETVFRKVLAKATSSYLGSVREVLDSVDKISSSLHRLKRGGKATVPGNEGAATDDEKIRLQISLDLAEFRRSAEELAEMFKLNPSSDWRPLDDLADAAAKVPQPAAIPQ